MFCNILICDFIRGRLLNAKKPEKVFNIYTYILQFKENLISHIILHFYF